MTDAKLTTAQHGHERPVFGCDQCIEVGNRYSAEGELPDGWAYYRVEVTRTMSSDYYIKAPSRKIAVEDAEVIDLSRDEFNHEEQEVYVSQQPATPQNGDVIYTGGPDGTWETMRDDEVAS